MKAICWHKDDGTVAITYPAGQPERGETEEQFLERKARTFKSKNPQAANWVRKPDLDVETEVRGMERAFRGAWVHNGRTLAVDMPKARDIHRAHLRVMRRPVLEQLDADYLRADERGDITEKQRIAAKKQALRDVTADPAIEAARTPEELKAAIPAALSQ